MANQHEAAARARKVQRLVEYFDRRLHELGRDPIAEASTIAKMLRDSISEAQWASHALLAGQRKPSPTTIAEVIAVYERRAIENKSSNVVRMRMAGVH